jgi:hypothetical protein
LLDARVVVCLPWPARYERLRMGKGQHEFNHGLVSVVDALGLAPKVGGPGLARAMADKGRGRRTWGGEGGLRGGQQWGSSRGGLVRALTVLRRGVCSGSRRVSRAVLCGVSAQGLKDVHMMLVRVAKSVIAGGETGVFSPMHLLLFRKPDGKK